MRVPETIESCSRPFESLRLLQIGHLGSHAFGRRFQDVVSIDFFGNPLREQVEHALSAMQTSKTKSLTPEIGSITPAEYRNRVWVTRPRPGVDRVTSAWFRNFIDPKAKFAFAPEEKKPPKAVPFDMYEGGFGHRGEDCTFETLLKVFRIRDKKTPVMVEIVHDADLFDSLRRDPPASHLANPG